MPFDLQVEFAGLCLYVVNPDNRRVAVLMPDARRRPGHDPAHHFDDKPAVPHVGYIRFNLANLAIYAPPVPAGVDRMHREGPEYELLHRFDRQILDFDGAFQPEGVEGELEVPSFDAFAPDLELVPGLFTARPPDVLLMRTVLEGGRLSGSLMPREQWIFPTHLHPEGKGHGGTFASSATWTRRVEAESVTLRITDFAGVVQASFPLRPATPGGTVSVKVANLCADNPLEWEELNIRKVIGPDLDFKWLYRLFEPAGTTFDALLKVEGVEEFKKELPVPIPISLLSSGSDDCMPGQKTGTF